MQITYPASTQVHSLWPGPVPGAQSALLTLASQTLRFSWTVEFCCSYPSRVLTVDLFEPRKPPSALVALLYCDKTP